MLALVLTAAPIGAVFWRTAQLEEKSVFAGTSIRLIELIELFVSNVREVSEWIWIYWTPPVVILGLLGLLIAVIKRQGNSTLLGALAFIPIITFVSISRILFPRYLLFAT